MPIDTPGFREREHPGQHTHHLVALVRLFPKLVVQGRHIRPFHRRDRKVTEFRQDVQLHQPSECFLRGWPAVHRDMRPQVSFGKIRHRGCRARDRVIPPLDPIDDGRRLSPRLFRAECDMGANAYALERSVGPVCLGDVHLAPGAVDPDTEAGKITVPEEGIGAILETELGHATIVEPDAACPAQATPHALFACRPPRTHARRIG